MTLSALNNRITFIRKHLRLSKPELAQYLGVSEELVNKVEANTAEIPLTFLNAMLQKLDVSTDWLLTGLGPMFISFSSNLVLDPEEPILSEQYFSLKEEALEDRIRDLEQNIIHEANIPLQHIRSLFTQLLEFPSPSSESVPTFDKLEELSYSNKVIYCKELEMQFKSAREEFLNHFKQLYQNVSEGKFRRSE